jgi:predicted transcriptional regulator
MSRDAEPQPDPLTPHVATVLAAYVGRQDVAPDDLAALARTIHAALSGAGQSADAKPERVPAVPVEDSVTDSHIVCLEDGKPYQSLKRHLRVAYGLSPEEYRAKWGLPDDYPMVSPAYARRRSELAKKAGLGRS